MAEENPDPLEHPLTFNRRALLSWASEHGTTIVLLGSDAAPDSVLGNPKGGEDDIKGLLSGWL